MRNRDRDVIRCILDAVRQQNKKYSDRCVCSVPRCRETTREQKDFCLAHLDRLAYVKELKSELLKRKIEKNKALRCWKHIDINGSCVQEILGQLSVREDQTPERLAINSDMSVRHIKNYLKALKHVGLIEIVLVKSIRGGFKRIIRLSQADCNESRI